MNLITDNYVFFAVALSYLSRYGSVKEFVKRPVCLIFDMLLYSALCEWLIDFLIPSNSHEFIAMIIVIIAFVIICLRVTGRITIVQKENGDLTVNH